MIARSPGPEPCGNRQVKHLNPCYVIWNINLEKCIMLKFLYMSLYGHVEHLFEACASPV